MKTILKILGGLVLLVILALILIPIIFKDDIVKMVKDETNAALNATVDFGDFDLSLIKSFPNFYFTIENVKVTGIGDFEGLELAAIKELNLTVDLMSVINGETINVKNITILEPNIHAKVLADG
ncbi:MAG: AsmA family protein, partial [Flavobacteriales bacterium]|nr:AsmA family protein [Flavobacteriales bacterium]